MYSCRRSVLKNTQGTYEIPQCTAIGLRPSIASKNTLYCLIEGMLLKRITLDNEYNSEEYMSIILSMYNNEYNSGHVLINTSERKH